MRGKEKRARRTKEQRCFTCIHSLKRTNKQEEEKKHTSIRPEFFFFFFFYIPTKYIRQKKKKKKKPFSLSLSVSHVIKNNHTNIYVFMLFRGFQCHKQWLSTQYTWSTRCSWSKKCLNQFWEIQSICIQRIRMYFTWDQARRKTHTRARTRFLFQMQIKYI